MSDTTALFQQLVRQLVGAPDAIGSFVGGAMLAGAGAPVTLVDPARAQP